MQQNIDISDAPTLSPSAAARICEIASRSGKAAALRISIDGGGCSGFSYRFALAEGAEAVADGDIVTHRDGADLVVDSISFDLLRGAEVDYVEALGGSAFKVSNPIATSGCGCGSSFSV